MEKLLNELTIKSRDILGENLVGIYLHGSLAMGHFKPKTSDIDLIIVVNSPLSHDEKRKYLEMITSLDERIEMSIVLRSACRPFVHPAPFELHISKAHLASYKADPDGYIIRMTGTDRDLAAHFSIINTHGKKLYGEEISDVFDIVSREDYMDSIIYDIVNAASEITENPVYFTLNLCRALAYKRKGLILSKGQGGLWGMVNIPGYSNFIFSAVQAQHSGEEMIFDADKAVSFAHKVLDEIL
ncbi:MAG: DUF4111 domain-containing protein [Clostridia bacterium]|nr:DUF4111 domain-containing protein [Clostridia bacterium]